MLSKIKKKKLIPSILFFFICFFFFFLRNHHYLRSELEITGYFDKSPDITLQWDSGNGFNSYESVSLDFLSLEIPEEKTLHKIEIQRTGEKNPLACSSEVWIKDMFTDEEEEFKITRETIMLLPAEIDVNNLELLRDRKFSREELTAELSRTGYNKKDIDIILNYAGRGKSFNFKDMCVEGKTYMANRYLGFFADGATLSYSGKFSRMKIRFLMDSKSGKVRISLDGKEQEVLDLYSETSSYKVIEIKDKTTFIPGIYFSSLLLPLHKIKGIKISTEREKDKFRIEGVRIKSSRREILLPVNKGDYVSEIVFENREFKDKIFSPTLFGVQILLAFLMAYLLYEFLSLPERLKQSSWKSTFLYVFIREKHFLFWVMFIISSGIFSLWLLGHWPASMSPDSMDTWLQVEGRNFHNHHPYVYSMYVLFLTQFIDTPSVVCIFQILLISLLGSFIFYFAIKNGVSFYLVLPFFFLFIFSVPVGLFNIVLWKDIPFSFLIIFWAFYLYYRSYRKKKDLKDSFSFKKIFLLSFLFIFLCMVRHNGIVYIVCLPFFLAISGVMTKKEFVRFLILSCSLFILFRFIIPELIGVRGLKEVFSNPGRIIKNESNLMVKSVFGAYLPEYMSEKTYIFLKTLNGRDNEIYYNLLTDRDQLLSANPTIFKTTYRIALSPKSNFLYKIQSNILYRSFTDISIRLLIWNSLVPFFMLLVVFLLYRWLPLSALYSLFILVQPLCLFFVSHVTSWRYMYFIYLSGFFVFPLVFLEIKDRCRQRVMKDSQ